MRDRHLGLRQRDDVAAHLEPLDALRGVAPGLAQRAQPVVVVHARGVLVDLAREHPPTACSVQGGVKAADTSEEIGEGERVVRCAFELMFERYRSHSGGSGIDRPCLAPNRRPAWRGQPAVLGVVLAQLQPLARRAPAALAHVAAARRAHLRPAGHAERGVDGGAGDLLQELGGGVGLALVDLRRDLAVLGAVGVLGLEGVGAVVDVAGRRGLDRLARRARRRSPRRSASARRRRPVSSRGS